MTAPVKSCQVCDCPHYNEWFRTSDDCGLCRCAHSEESHAADVDEMTERLGHLLTALVARQNGAKVELTREELDRCRHAGVSVYEDDQTNTVTITYHRMLADADPPDGTPI